MKLFNLAFDAPIYRFEGRITNNGPGIPEKSGVLTVRAFDEQENELPPRVIGLSTSTHLDVAFIYFPPTPSHGQTTIPPFTFARPVARMEIGYESLFAKVPVDVDHLGVISYLADNAESDHPGIACIDFGWPVNAG